MGNKRTVLAPLDTSSVSERTPSKGQKSAVAELGDMGDHIKRLKQASGTAQSLITLIVDHIQVLSVTVPVRRGFGIAGESRERAKAHHQGLENAFKPLRDHIENEKALFYTKHEAAIKKLIRKRVEEGVKRKLPGIIKEKLGRYEEYIKTSSRLTDKVNQVVAITSARAANSILCPNYPEEEVTLITPNPRLGVLTLGNLKNIGGNAAARLARDQGLMPVEDSSDAELARARNLNMILRHIGVQYQAVPSRNGLLLTSVTNRGNP